MSEKINYNSEKYINFGDIKTILYNSDVKYFISMNLKLSDSETLDALKKLTPIGFDVEYLKIIIQKYRRKIKIDNLLN